MYDHFFRKNVKFYEFEDSDFAELKAQLKELIQQKVQLKA